MLKIFSNISKSNYTSSHPQIKKENNSSLQIYKTAKVIIDGELIIGTNKVTHLSKNPAILIIRDNSQLIIGRNVLIGPGVSIIVNDNSKLTIADNTYIAADSKIYCSKEIFIGKNSVLSWGLTIIDSDFHQIVFNKQKKMMVKKIQIGDHVWIGANVNVLKGVNIGDGSIIAAGTIMCKSCQKNMLVAGNPGRIIKRGVVWN